MSSAILAQKQLSSSHDLAFLRVAIASDAAPERNGVGTYYHDLSQHLRREVGEVEIFSPTANGRSGHGGFSIPLPSDATQRLLIPDFLRLKNDIDAYDPHVVIVATPGPFGLFGAYYGRKINARVLVGFHTWIEKLTDLYWNRLQGAAARQAVQIGHRFLFRYADCVLATSADMREIALRNGAEEVEVIATPVAYSFIHTPLSEPSRTVERVIFAGRLVAEKNISAILEAARRLPHITFTLIGEGPERQKIAAAARELGNIRHRGWLERTELLEEIDDHDLLVLPSFVESFGTIALEGLARQRYTLVSPACGISLWPEMTPGLFTIEDGESLAEAIARVAALPYAERAAVARAGRVAAVNLHEQNLDHWLQLLQPVGAMA